MKHQYIFSTFDFESKLQLSDKEAENIGKVFFKLIEDKRFEKETERYSKQTDGIVCPLCSTMVDKSNTFCPRCLKRIRK